MTAIVIQGDARHLPLPDASIDLIVTSPPYFALRSYTDDGQHYHGQIGSEATPPEYLEALWACTTEWMRCLKPEGSIWVNLGDKYVNAEGGRQSAIGEKPQRTKWSDPKFRTDRDSSLPRSWSSRDATTRVVLSDGPRVKSLMGIPWRYALGCIDRLGLILRAEVVWCLSGGARIYARTPTGDRPVMLRDLVRSYLPENVQLWNGERWTQVLGWNRSPERNGAIEIELRTGERIGCTTEHRWPTKRGIVHADEIRIGDVIDTIRLPEPDQPRQPAALDDEVIGWLIGLYIAEGSRSEKTLQFAGHVRETARHDRLRRIADAYDGACAVYQTGENTATCNISGAILLGIIDRYVGRGRTARSKRLRHAVWQRSDRFLAAVVDGYLSGDGHYDAKNDRWRLGFGPNDELAADLRTLAGRLGAKISLRRHNHMFAGRRYPGWRGEWRWTRSAHWNARPDGEVVAIRVSRAREFYDIGVADEPHLFALASGVLTHNSKPNGLPESVTDRVRRSHEQWFHLVKQPRYYAAVDEIRESYSENKPWGLRSKGASMNGGLASGEASTTVPWQHSENPLGKLPGSVWSIPSEPLLVPPHLGVDHFAAFPTEWPRRLVLGWSPPGICTACGQGRRPVVAKDRVYTQRTYTGTRTLAGVGNVTNPGGQDWLPGRDTATITGYACTCPEPTAPTRPSVIVDPFGGTGTTALVAHALGRVGVTVDMSGDYSRLAKWRCTDRGELAKALRVPKPPPVPDGQDGLFEVGA